MADSRSIFGSEDHGPQTEGAGQQSGKSVYQSGCIRVWGCRWERGLSVRLRGGGSAGDATAVGREALEACGTVEDPGVPGLTAVIWQEGCWRWGMRRRCGRRGGSPEAGARACTSGCEVGPWRLLLTRPSLS